MGNKRPYDDLLKNLFHEQAAKIVPLFLPDFHVEEVYDIEMPDLKSFPLERPPTPLEEGLVGLAMPQAQVVQVYRTEWVEHSGTYERAYRITNSETDKPCFLVVEVQTKVEENNHLANHLLSNFVSIDLHIHDTILATDDDEDTTEEQEDESAKIAPPQREPENPQKNIFRVKVTADSAVEANNAGEPDAADAVNDETGEEDDFWGNWEKEEEGKGTIINEGYYNYPFALCPFSSQVPQPIRNEFMGRVMLAFNFKTINLWEKDAREFLNSHAYAVYYLLPTMKNADATLLKLAIAELAQHFQDNEAELARH
ncbi:MAG TPA: hypothetical protein VGM01_03235, partial [Ktedonobacteraceae bacterium]